MNQGRIDLDHDKAKQCAKDIMDIATKVSSIFDDTNTEIQKLQQNWIDTSSDSSSQSAVDIYNQYKGNFERFLDNIKTQASNIEIACTEWQNRQSTTTKDFDSATRIN